MTHPGPRDVNEFVELVLRSKLLSFETLQKVCADFTTVGKGEAALEGFCSRLIDKGRHTKWQCEMLRSGKHRGFYLDNYQFLDRLRVAGNETIYLVKDLNTRTSVALAVRNSKKPPYIKYRVVKVIDE